MDARLPGQLVGVDDGRGRAGLRVAPERLKGLADGFGEGAVFVADKAGVPLAAHAESPVGQVGAADDEAAHVPVFKEPALGVEAVGIALPRAVDARLDVAKAHEAADGPRLREGEVVRGEDAARHALLLKLLEDLQEGRQPAQGDEGHGDVEAPAGFEFGLDVLEHLVATGDVAEHVRAQLVLGDHRGVNEGGDAASAETVGNVIVRYVESLIHGRQANGSQAFMQALSAEWTDGVPDAAESCALAAAGLWCGGRAGSRSSATAAVSCIVWRSPRLLLRAGQPGQGMSLGERPGVWNVGGSAGDAVHKSEAVTRHSSL